MKVYLGQTRSAGWTHRLASCGFGEMTQPEELPARRRPYVFDNGAFKAWRSGKPFDAGKYSRALARIIATDDRPDFIVTPDKVAAGLESLAFSLEWVERLRVVAPVYLVVQDGMTERDVQSVLDKFDGLFVGGSLAWKYQTGAAWVEFAHCFAMPCHVGRVGTEKQVRWALRIGADSIDSCTPLWAEANFQRFIRGFCDTGQGDLL